MVTWEPCHEQKGNLGQSCPPCKARGPLITLVLGCMDMLGQPAGGGRGCGQCTMMRANASEHGVPGATWKAKHPLAFNSQRHPAASTN